MEKSMKKQSVSRTVRFWGGYVEKIFLMVLAISAVYVLFLPVLINEDMKGTELFLLRASYAVMMEGIIIFVLPFSYPTYNLPLALSFGSGRREAVAGMQLSNLLAVGQNLLIVGIVELAAGKMAAVSGREFFAYAGIGFAAAAGILLAIAAIGQFGAALILKFGAKGMAIYIIIFVLAVFAGALTVGFSFGTGQIDDAEILSMLLDAHVLQVIKRIVSVLLTVDVAAYIVGYLVLKRTVMRYEVRM